MTNLREAINVNRPVTLFYLSMFGIQRIECRELSVKFVDFAQYVNIPKITYLQPRKRKNETMIKGYKPWYVVVEGHNLPQSLDAMEDVQGGRMTRHACFDEAYSNEAEEFINELSKTHTVLFDYRTAQ